MYPSHLVLIDPLKNIALKRQQYVGEFIVIAPIPEAVAPEHAVSTGSPSSTIVDQDAPSPSNSHTTQETQTPIISHDVEEDNHDIEVAHMGSDPYFGILILEVTSDQSSSSDVIHTIVPPVEPKNYKEALTQACWIEVMQEELHEFERLEVWELVPLPDKAFVISAIVFDLVPLGLWSSVCGWYAVLISKFVPKSSDGDLQKLDANLGSRSQMIETGIPCLVTTSFKYNLASLSKGSVSLIGVKIADLVSRSTITQIVS
ncbi:hypothetical protein Tco_0924480 [Tanacetum coccineum]|uniref:Gag-Pol polyprotein n=1 Tax=Tanacetum coccineum TaxID=301880 RepID=A0ABQ5D3Z1_9ASTR